MIKIFAFLKRIRILTQCFCVSGCVLRLQYEGQTALQHVGSLDCSLASGDGSDSPGAATAPTFGITVTLRQAQVSWGQRMAR